MDPTITTADAPEHARTTGRRRRRQAAGLALAVGLTLALAACGDDDDGGDNAASDNETTTTTAADQGDQGGGGGGEAVSYEVSSLQYHDVTAPSGGTVDIDNTSGVSHTFTSDNDAFDEVDYGPDETATVDVPSEPGEYPFHCEIHANMQATLTVD
jgi:plastocyanin